jgi:hypothetical protein
MCDQDLNSETSWLRYHDRSAPSISPTIKPIWYRKSERTFLLGSNRNRWLRKECKYATFSPILMLVETAGYCTVRIKGSNPKNQGST